MTLHSSGFLAVVVVVVLVLVVTCVILVVVVCYRVLFFSVLRQVIEVIMLIFG